MLLKEIISYLEGRAHPRLQESYDNSGLLVGNPGMEITSVLICLDSTPAVIREAKEKGCNLVIAHHPIIFSGLKRLTGKNYIERTIIEAIRNDIAIYAIHTNLDNVSDGVNHKIATRLGLIDTRVLSPKRNELVKLSVFVPGESAEKVRQSIFNAGAGYIGNYDECSFSTEGVGTFRPGKNANPFSGQAGVRSSEKETRIETILPKWKSTGVLQALRQSHPYEEIAYDVYPLENEWSLIGSGMIGNLPEPIAAMEFLRGLKSKLKTECVRHTALLKDKVSRIAVCGGSGSFLLNDAIREGADVLVTADFKYHQFFDADEKIVIADVGHFESEQFTMELLGEWLAEKFPTFATHLTGVVTNPVHYL